MAISAKRLVAATRRARVRPTPPAIDQPVLIPPIIISPIIQDINPSVVTEDDLYRLPPIMEPLPALSSSEPPSTSSSPAEPRCMVCFEPKPLTAIGTSNCSHDSRVCEECLERHIEISVCDRGFTNVTCPLLSCNEVLSYEDILAGVHNKNVLSR
ncbi:unnamed protein product [Rhizoctonia solani]|uniref:RING-type domain-containing protein n=1 Tax=Rhizoctonia solani TaxID=456999 RepID=A0A8H3GG97_9AGAM|nr:unnamed protein product [Rhizoctonia solani]